MVATQSYPGIRVQKQQELFSKHGKIKIHDSTFPQSTSFVFMNFYLHIQADWIRYKPV